MNNESNSTLHNFLNQNRGVIVMDGATSTEIYRRGFGLDDIAWSAFAHVKYPRLVRTIHEDYISSGARLIVSNTFSTTKSILDEAGASDQFEYLNRAAVNVAKEARSRCGIPGVWIAGSISTLPPLNKPDKIPTGKKVAEYYRQQANLLCDAGVDLLIAEMMLDSDATCAIVEACLETGLPTWVGLAASYCHSTQDLIAYRPSGKYRGMGDQPFDEFISQVLDNRVQAFGIMHSWVSVTGMALEHLRKQWKGFSFAYAETGCFSDPGWNFTDAIEPEDYARQAQDWVQDFDLRAIGGCCGTNPAHIKALSEMVAESTARSEL